MKKENRNILEAIANINSRADVDTVCAMVDKAYQSDKIKWQDNELFYKLINKISAMVEA